MAHVIRPRRIFLTSALLAALSCVLALVAAPGQADWRLFGIVGTTGAIAGCLIGALTGRVQVVTAEVPIALAPGVVSAAMLAAVRDAAGVAAYPPAQCLAAKMTIAAIEYHIRFSVIRGTSAPVARANALTNVWYAVNRLAGAAAGESRTPGGVEIARKTIDATPFFVPLPSSLKDEIAQDATLEVWHAGERIVEQGTEADSCFVIRRGRLGVHVSHRDAQTHVATLGQGDLFGEMSLLTGKTRWATVRAEEDSEVLRIRASALKRALTRSPDLVQLLAETVMSRRDQLVEAQTLLDDAKTTTVSEAIRRFMIGGSCERD
jgi:CRP-like cAMP-binding protein